MTESANKEDRSPLYNRPKATMRMTESHHAAIKKSCAMAPTAQHFSLFTFHFSLPQDSLFVPDRTHFSLCTIHFSLQKAKLAF